MLEKPALKDERIISCLGEEYGLQVEGLTFLPLGADQDTAVYRAIIDRETHFFVKLRRGAFDQATILVPNYLSKLGLKHLIPSLTTQTGELWAYLEPFKLILYPYKEGQNGFEVQFTQRDWVEFGLALKSFHTAKIPEELTKSINRETFSPRWREDLKTHLGRVGHETYSDPIAERLGVFLLSKREVILDLVKRAERHAAALAAQSLENILCHGDIHLWNLLIDQKGGLFMVDWDTLIFAPKERDLMFVGAGLGDSGYTPLDEETLFYKGYGSTEINSTALAYYRYERVIEDIAIYCDQIFSSEGDGEDRIQALEYLKINFLSGGTISTARQADMTS